MTAFPASFLRIADLPDLKCSLAVFVGNACRLTR
jgi:hypothetical protein